MDEKIEDFFYENKKNMLTDLAELIEIPSVKGNAEEGAPFGKEPRRALEKMLEICKRLGFETSVCKDAVGTAVYPAGKDEYALGILSHLDVVPAEPDNWTTDPFKLSEREGVLYGRGVIDDKGPALASLYALYCIKECGIPLKKGVKLVFGTDEENGSEDLKLYLKEEKLPENVFTPDGSFPVINIEKGMMRSRFKGSYRGGNIISFHGGKIPNAIPDKAEALIAGISLTDVDKAISSLSGEAKFKAKQAGGNVKIECFGKSAHASAPFLGVNAVTSIIRLLSTLDLQSSPQTDIIRGLNRILPDGETDGAGIGLKRSDYTGSLTAAFDIFDMEHGICKGVLDVRFPSCLTLKEVVKKEKAAFNSAGCSFEGYMGDEPHIVDENSGFIQSLLRVYEKYEGEKGRCIAIGGGTYVHNINGGVAFGAERGGYDYRMHGDNEHIPTDELIKDAILYTHAIIEICG